MVLDGVSIVALVEVDMVDAVEMEAHELLVV